MSETELTNHDHKQYAPARVAQRVERAGQQPPPSPPSPPPPARAVLSPPPSELSINVGPYSRSADEFKTLFAQISERPSLPVEEGERFKFSSSKDGWDMYLPREHEIAEAIDDIMQVSPDEIVTSSQYFTEAELKCHGTGACQMNARFMRRTDWLRHFCGPLRSNSAYRAPEHNNKVSSTGMAGPHTTGHALDAGCSGSKAHRVLSIAMALGFTGIGISQKGPHAKRFIHLDDLAEKTGRARPWVWGY